MHLDRLIVILEAVAAAGRPVSAGEVQQVTGLPRPTCYRLLQMLAEQRLLEDPDQTSRYRIGQRLIRVAMLGTSDVDICQAAMATMKNAAVHFGEAVFLSRYRDRGVEIIHVETPADPARAYIHPGLGFRPMHACSCSKAIAAFADPAYQEAILNGPMKAYTDQTKTTQDALRAEFALICSRGFAECVEEIETGVSSVAAPVRIDSVGAPLSLGTIGPVRRFTADYRARLGAEMMDLADQVGLAIQLQSASS